MDVGARHLYFRDYEGYSLKLVGSHVMRVHARFEEERRVSWKIDLGELFG